MLAVDIVYCNKKLSTVLEMRYQICELLQSLYKGTLQSTNHKN